jgi:hypothetical protein
MQCPGVNENDVLQEFVVSIHIAAQNAHDRGAVLMIVYGHDDVATASYLRSMSLEKRNSISMPVLLLVESDGLNLREFMSNSEEPQMFAQLSKSAYCDSAWLYNVPLPDGIPRTCCSAADAVIAFTGFWKYNDFCAQSLDEFTMECDPLEDVNPAVDESGFLCKDDYQVFFSGGNSDYSANVICEEWGAVGLAGICQADFEHRDSCYGTVTVTGYGYG